MIIFQAEKELSNGIAASGYSFHKSVEFEKSMDFKWKIKLETFFQFLLEIPGFIQLVFLFLFLSVVDFATFHCPFIQIPFNIIYKHNPFPLKVMETLWLTSPFSPTNERNSSFQAIQKYADFCLCSFFKIYLNSSDTVSEEMEKYDPILMCYRSSFDHVLKELQSVHIENDTVVIWLLYNMGVIVKTPSGCFGVDIYHRWAKKLAPHLDFLLLTHEHQDHYSNELINLMFHANKPVLSNFKMNGDNYSYYSKTSRNISLGQFTIQTDITDHKQKLPNFMTVFRVDCSKDTGNFTLLHVVDSNYKLNQFLNVQGSVNLLIPRYAPNTLTENNILGTGDGKVLPDYIMLSHVLELSHNGVQHCRWPMSMVLERASKLHCNKTFVLFWERKLLLKTKCRWNIKYSFHLND